MSEEITNEVTPAVLAEGEAVIPAEKVEEFKAAVEEIMEAAQEAVEEIMEAAQEASVEEVPEAKVEEVAAEVIVEPTVSVAEETVDKNVISSSSKKTNTPSDMAAGLTGVAGGVIGTGAVKRKPAVKKEPESKPGDKVAIHSTRNVSWVGVGKVLKGVNIVTKDQADKWLTRDHVRLVTPDEVSKEYNR